MQNLPYMGGYPQKVIGKDSTQPILFGALGMFHESQRYQALQQVVQGKPDGKIPRVIESTHVHHNTERNSITPPAKTHIPNIHYGMVPFAGRFMTEHGHIEVYDAKKHHHDKYDNMGELMHEG